MPSPQSVDEAHRLLKSLGAPLRLLRHVCLVGEAADLLLVRFKALGIAHDADFVRLGVALHDAGKVVHPGELDGGGNAHEPDGERLLLDHGVDPAVARCCLSHARWARMECSLEELIVALADTLWKGKRNPELETRVIQGACDRMGRAFWDLFIDLDSCFEGIAAGGAERLSRSR